MSKATVGLNLPNNNANFVPADELWEMKLLPFKASTPLIAGGAVGVEISSNTTTGNVTVMGVENAAGADFVGILAETIATTDSDYATSGKLKSVLVPISKSAKARFLVTAGTFTAVDVFKTVEITSGSLGLSVDTAGKGARILEYLDATHGICEFSLPATETA